MQKKTKSLIIKTITLFLCILLTFCNKKDVSGKTESRGHETTDSVRISVELPPQASCGFNIRDTLFNNHYLTFKNEKNEKIVITKKYPITLKSPIIKYIMMTKPNGKFKMIRHYYLISNDYKVLDFKFEDGDIFLKKNSEEIVIDSIYDIYNELSIKIFKNKLNNKHKLKKLLDSVYISVKNVKTSKNHEKIIQLNKLLYLSNLQKIYPFHKNIDDFVLKHDKSSYIHNLTIPIITKYIRDRKGKINPNLLNSKKYSLKSINILSLGMYQLLKSEDIIGDNEYNNSREWLKSTDLYKYNHNIIEKEITPLNNKEFKTRLSNLMVFDKKLSQTTFSDVIKKNPSDYYLIDFWATWCKPCLDGIQRIHKMEIPKNIMVINLGTDKPNNKENWKRKATETKQKISYLIDLSKKENNDFLRFIKLESIPRYILIDKDMNLINESYCAPHEPDFQFGLKYIKLYK